MLTRLLTLLLFTIFCLNSYCQKDNTWLWKIKQKGFKHSSYIFGTFHEAGNSVFDSFTKAKKFLIESNELLVESLDTTSDSQITQDDVNRGAKIWAKMLHPIQAKTFFNYIVKYNQPSYLAFPGSEIVINLHHDYISQFCSRWSSKDTLFLMDYQIELLARKKILM